MAKRSAQHSQQSVEHYSPVHMLDAAFRVTGRPDVDPFSCLLANEMVQAKRIITAAENGYTTRWCPPDQPGGAWINPPGGVTVKLTDAGKRIEESNQANAWCLTTRNYLEGVIRWAWFVVFNPSTFYQRAQEYARSEGLPAPQDFPRCEFASRIKYLHPVDERELVLPGVDAPRVEPGEQPPHGSALILLPETLEQAGKFREVFDPILGDVMIDVYRLGLVMERRGLARSAPIEAPAQGRLFE